MDGYKVHCTFDIFKFPHGESLFRCRVMNQNIPHGVQLIPQGNQLNGRGNRDVAHVKFENCTLTRVPQGLTKIFPNIRSMSIQQCGLKDINRSDLIEYKNIEKFICCENEIEYLPEDLFSGFENLKWIGLFKNKLRVIEPGLLDGLIKLKYVDFSDNPNFNMRYSVYPQYYSINASVEAIKNELLIKIHPTLKMENEELKAENEKLKSQRGIFNDLTDFILDESTKDFKIIIDGQEFPVHKFLLAARSPTLAEILKNNPEVENLNLVDISVEIFEIILKFLYTDELPGEDGTNFMHLFAAAGKLKIEKLKNFAAEKIINDVNEENAFDVVKIAAKYDHSKLKHGAFNFIKEVYPEIDFKDEWMEDHTKLSKVIEANDKKKEAMQRIEEEFKRVVMTD